MRKMIRVGVALVVLAGMAGLAGVAVGAAVQHHYGQYFYVNGKMYAGSCSAPEGSADRDACYLYTKGASDAVDAIAWMLDVSCEAEKDTQADELATRVLAYYLLHQNEEMVKEGSAAGLVLLAMQCDWAAAASGEENLFNGGKVIPR